MVPIYGVIFSSVENKIKMSLHYESTTDDVVKYNNYFTVYMMKIGA